jgi:hypothetical protein
MYNYDKISQVINCGGNALVPQVKQLCYEDNENKFSIKFLFETNESNVSSKNFIKLGTSSKAKIIYITGI